MGFVYPTFDDYGTIANVGILGGETMRNNMEFLQVLSYFVRTCGRWQGHIFFSTSRPLPLRTWPRRGSNRSVVLRSALRGYLHLPGRRGTLCPAFLVPLIKEHNPRPMEGFGKGRSSIIPKMAKPMDLCAPLDTDEFDRPKWPKPLSRFGGLWDTSRPCVAWNTKIG